MKVLHVVFKITNKTPLRLSRFVRVGSNMKKQRILSWFETWLGQIHLTNNMYKESVFDKAFFF